MCNPIARTAGSSAKNSKKSSWPSTAWFPAETIYAIGSERWLMVMSDENIPDWVMIAAP